MQDASDERLKLLYKRVAVEQDPEKFSELMKEINNLLEARRIASAQEEGPPIAIRYEIRRKFQNGDLLCVAKCADRRTADELAQSLNQVWQEEYEVVEVVADDDSART